MHDLFLEDAEYSSRIAEFPLGGDDDITIGLCSDQGKRLTDTPRSGRELDRKGWLVSVVNLVS